MDSGRTPTSPTLNHYTVHYQHYNLSIFPINIFFSTSLSLSLSVGLNDCPRILCVQGIWTKVGLGWEESIRNLISWETSVEKYERIRFRWRLKRWVAFKQYEWERQILFSSCCFTNDHFLSILASFSPIYDFVTDKMKRDEKDNDWLSLMMISRQWEPRWIERRSEGSAWNDSLAAGFLGPLMIGDQERKCQIETESEKGKSCQTRFSFFDQDDKEYRNKYQNDEIYDQVDYFKRRWIYFSSSENRIL